MGERSAGTFPVSTPRRGRRSTGRRPAPRPDRHGGAEGSFGRAALAAQDRRGADAGRRRLLPFHWDRFWDDPDQRPSFLADWPGLSGEACALLLSRGVRIVGSDCLSIDRFGSLDFPAHTRLLGANVLIGENFADLGLLPPYCLLAALPLPVVGGSGSPARAVAFVSPD